MTTTLLTPTQWADSEFAAAQLGDPRRTQRLVKIANPLAQSPGGTRPQAFPVWSELKAASRFFNQPKVPFEQIQRPHWQRPRAVCQQAGESRLIEDPSELDYPDPPATEELGPIGDGCGRGLLLPTTLAVRGEGWEGEERPPRDRVGLVGPAMPEPHTAAPPSGNRAATDGASTRVAALGSGVGGGRAARRQHLDLSGGSRVGLLRTH